MRAFWIAIFLTAALFASANARPGTKAENHKRKVRSLVFTGEPQNSRFNQNYDEFSKDQNDYSANRFPPQSEFSEYFNGPIGRSENDAQMNTNDIDDYVDSDQGEAQDDDNDFDLNDYSSFEDSQADLQRAMDSLRRQLHLKNNEFDVDNVDDSPKGKRHDDQYDGDDDDDDDVDDDDDDDDYDEESRFLSEHDRTLFHRILKLVKGLLHSKGDDFDVDNGQKENEDGFVKHGDEHQTGGFPAVPKFDESRKGPFYGQDVDYDMETNKIGKDFNPPMDRSQNGNDEIDDSDEFADSDEFDSDGNWKGEGDVQGKLPNQDIDGGSSSMDNNGKNSPQEPDGRGVIEPRLGETQRFTSRGNFDFVPNVQRWKRSDFTSQESQRYHQCAEICNLVKFGAKNTPQIRSLCNCENYLVRDRK